MNGETIYLSIKQHYSTYSCIIYDVLYLYSTPYVVIKQFFDRQNNFNKPKTNKTASVLG